MASLSAQLVIVPSRPWRMTRIQTRISHVHPTASIHQRRTLLGVLRAGAPQAMLWRTRVPVTRSEATVERWMGAARTTRRSRRSGPAEDRAQPAEGRSRRTGGGGSGPTTSIRNAGGAFISRMTAETLSVRADIACVIYICTWAVTTTRKCNVHSHAILTLDACHVSGRHSADRLAILTLNACHVQTPFQNGRAGAQSESHIFANDGLPLQPSDPVWR
jgi:hypothetical protein